MDPFEKWRTDNGIAVPKSSPDVMQFGQAAFEAGQKHATLPGATFEEWWSDHPGLASLHREVAHLAFTAGMARSRNYVADEAVMPESVTFANGRTVRIVENKAPGVHLEVQ